MKDLAKRLRDIANEVEKQYSTENKEFKKSVWYYHISTGSLGLYNHYGIENVGFESGYGSIDIKEWTKSMTMTDPSEWRLATEQEVKDALINEARKRGFKFGVTIKFNTETVHHVTLCRWDFAYRDGLLQLGGYIIFDEITGQWAKIITTPEIYIGGHLVEFIPGKSLLEEYEPACARINDNGYPISFWERALYITNFNKCNLILFGQTVPIETINQIIERLKDEK